MFRRIVLLSAAAGLALSVAACNDATSVIANTNGNSNVEEQANVGTSLYTPKPVPSSPSDQQFGAEPILIPGYTSDPSKVAIPSQRDSKILWIGTEIKPGEPEPADKANIYTHHDKKYRRLEVGEHVDGGQIVMLLDDSEAYAMMEASRVEMLAAEVVLEKARQVRKNTEEIYRAKYDQWKANGSFSNLELKQSEIEWRRAQATEAQQEADYKKQVEEYNQKKVVHDYFTIRTNISGTIQPFNQRPGQAVKALDTVLEVQSNDTLRAEGDVLSGYTGRLKRGMPVTIEPAVNDAPRVHRRFHTQEINGVAVYAKNSSQFVVSVSNDKTARVWDGRSDYETAIWTHPGSVRSVACSPPGAAHAYCLTGAEDGIGRLWDLSNPKSGSTPVRELLFPHKGVISSVAFSPDGKYCVTADSRDIVMWDVESGAKKYVLPQRHLGEITSVVFTPQAKLVSASRDNSICVWSLGQEGAKLDYRQEGRTGEVIRPGISPDGRYFVMDIGTSLRLMTLAERRTEGTLSTVSDTSKFSTFALFSQDGRLLLTASQGDGSLSLWRTPTPGKRATELRHLTPRERSVIFTSAAIAPREDEPFAVTGTKNGEIYIWSIPSEKDTTPIPGVLKFIDQNAAGTTHQVRVWAEFPNTMNPPLPIGSNVTIIVDPAAAK